jgi:ribosomal protein RSM22 (predicted rRNA methylase)
MFLFPCLKPEIRRIVEHIPALIDETFPLPRRFRAGLPHDIAMLSRLLTSERGNRSESYLGRKPLLSAYLRYFLPWNLYRLCRLLPALALNLAEGDALTDLGAGPLTLPIALWISRPDLRNLSLEFRCVDKTALVLDAGKQLFYALAGNVCPWRIKTIRAPLDAPVKGAKAALVSAAHVFNELYWNIPHTDKEKLAVLADKKARLLSELVSESGSILVVEPGIPRAGEFIAVLRSSFLEHGYVAKEPCPHQEPCPFPGGKSKWCHFAFETQDAPESLLKLSAAARLPKERAVLSFLLTGPRKTETFRSQEQTRSGKGRVSVRIISDPFPVSIPLRRTEQEICGRYGCSALGMILVIGEKQDIAKQESGALIQLSLRSPEQRDPRSGALIGELSKGLG